MLGAVSLFVQDQAGVEHPPPVVGAGAEADGAAVPAQAFADDRVIEQRGGNIGGNAGIGGQILGVQYIGMSEIEQAAAASAPSGVRSPRKLTSSRSRE